MPASGRRPLRVAGRPQSMLPTVPSQAPYMTGALSDPSTPVPSQGRNRLQKKVPHRNSAAAFVGPPGNVHTPLAPITPYQDNYGYRSLPRAATIDFAGENPAYQKNYGGSGGGFYGGSPNGAPHRNSFSGGGGGGAPPIPAKVPMSTNGMPPDEGAWRLLEEMRNIDLGGGRSRRRG
jgi:hypothetical protein